MAKPSSKTSVFSKLKHDLIKPGSWDDPNLGKYSESRQVLMATTTLQNSTGKTKSVFLSDSTSTSKSKINSTHLGPVEAKPHWHTWEPEAISLLEDAGTGKLLEDSTKSQEFGFGEQNYSNKKEQLLL